VICSKINPKFDEVPTTDFLPYTQAESIHADYIYHKNEKRKPPKMDLPFLKNDIPNNLWPQKPVVYSESVEKAQLCIFPNFTCNKIR